MEPIQDSLWNSPHVLQLERRSPEIQLCFLTLRILPPRMEKPLELRPRFEVASQKIQM